MSITVPHKQCKTSRACRTAADRDEWQSALQAISRNTCMPVAGENSSRCLREGRHVHGREGRHVHGRGDGKVQFSIAEVLTTPVTTQGKHE
eukprot:1141976-Pelagomonas_calceolata.AAC.6